MSNYAGDELIAKILALLPTDESREKFIQIGINKFSKVYSELKKISLVTDEDWLVAPIENISYKEMSGIARDMNITYLSNYILHTDDPINLLTKIYILALLDLFNAVPTILKGGLDKA